KLLFVGLVIGGAAAAAAVLNNRNSGGSYEFDAPPVPRTAPTTSTSQDSSAPTAPSSQNASTQTGSDAGQAPWGDSPAERGRHNWAGITGPAERPRRAVSFRTRHTIRTGERYGGHSTRHP